MILAVLGLAILAQTEGAEIRHVVVISIDGLRPDFYLTEGWGAEHLRAWSREGAHARGVEGVYPSVTYAAHATMLTGVSPARHGVVANTKFGPEGPSREWFWETHSIRVRTLWDAAREKGVRTAVLFWPSSVGAPVDWLVAERWPVFEGEQLGALLGKHSTPGLLAELAFSIGVPSREDARDFAAIDRFVSDALCHLLRRRRPQLAFMHLLQVDFRQHAQGTDADAVRAAVKDVDAILGKVRAALEEAGLMRNTLLVVVGDHGFQDADTVVAPNALLAEAGLITLKEGRIVEWRAMIHPLGGSAAVYVKGREGGLRRRVADVLERGSRHGGRRLYTLMARKRLDELGYNPEAAMALEGGDGVMFGGSATGPVTNPVERRGTHGGLPSGERMKTGFVAVGAGVGRGKVIERMRLHDLAPTVAQALGLDLKDVEGSAVPLR